MLAVKLGRGGRYIHILQPTSSQLERPGPWALFRVRNGNTAIEGVCGAETRVKHTNNQGNHACSVSPGSLKPLDEFLHLPYFDLPTRSLAGPSHWSRGRAAGKEATDILLGLASLRVTHSDHVRIDALAGAGKGFLSGLSGTSCACLPSERKKEAEEQNRVRWSDGRCRGFQRDDKN